MICFIPGTLHAQEEAYEKFRFLLGEWEGRGTGFGNDSSTINSSFRLVMNGTYIEVKNESRFEPSDTKPEGEVHKDHGFISYDSQRDKLVFRQFNIEGYINTYQFVDSLSNEQRWVFLTESIENFPPGGAARWTIRKINENQCETLFDVSFPGQDFSCFGTNRLHRKE